MKNLYHGSVSLFEQIDLSRGKGYKDFGNGFYATAIAGHAEKIAIRNKEIIIKRQSVLKAKNPKIKLEPVMAYRYNLIFDENTENLSVKVFTKADAECFAL